MGGSENSPCLSSCSPTAEALSPSFLRLCLRKCPLAALESFPIYLNLPLPSQPNSHATSSWKPSENSHSAPFSSRVNVPRGPHCPIPARLLDHSSLPLRGGPWAESLSNRGIHLSESVAPSPQASPQLLSVPQSPLCWESRCLPHPLPQLVGSACQLTAMLSRPPLLPCPGSLGHVGERGGGGGWTAWGLGLRSRLRTWDVIPGGWAGLWTRE